MTTIRKLDAPPDDPRRRAALRRVLRLGKTVLAASGLGLLAGCHRNATGGSATAGRPSSAATAGPSVGAHAIAYEQLGHTASVLSTPAVAASAPGSLLLIGVGRGSIRDAAQAIPRDASNRAAVALDPSSHAYTRWPTSGTNLYTLQRGSASGGERIVVVVDKPLATDEVTLSVVEVVGGTTILDHSWTQVEAGRPLRSLPVTTNVPALLVAWWWGDDGSGSRMTARPDWGDEAVLDGVLFNSNGYVQCAVAAKAVPAGTHDVTWTATPPQGAQLYLVAVGVQPAGAQSAGGPLQAANPPGS
ncbi:MAG TPA: hypothetical protein VMU33_07260 [Burkholderiaceae bacterium]|nr:hypothetical protein [Burkholderiaceae bacterium]